MNYVLIEDGVVVQSDRTGWDPAEGFIEAPEEVVPGYTYDGTEFSPPEPVIRPPAPPAPLSCTDLQFRLALNQTGLRSSVEDYVASADQDTKDWWERSVVIHSNHPLLIEAADALGKTEEDITQLIELGRTL